MIGVDIKIKGTWYTVVGHSRAYYICTPHRKPVLNEDSDHYEYSFSHPHRRYVEKRALEDYYQGIRKFI